jgi:predicted permease
VAFFGEWLRRIGYLLNRRRIDRDLQREMEIHREMMGEPVRFGNMLRLREESRDVWGWNWLDTAWLDLKFAARTLRHSPGFTIGAAIILALGMGLNLTLFEIYNNVVLKPLTVRNVETLVELGRLSARSEQPLSYPAAEFIRSNNTALKSVLLSNRWKTATWADSEDSLPVRFVSSNWFDELGYGAASGRLFHETIDDRADAQPVVVVSYRFWTRQLNGDPTIIGSTVRINGRPATLLGVVPEAFPTWNGPPAQLWMPIEQAEYFFPDAGFKAAWDNGDVEVYGYLSRGMSVAATRDALRPLMDEVAAEQPKVFRKGEWLEPYAATTHFERPWERTQRLRNVFGFGFLSLLVLTVACANLGNLVLSRSVGRMRELSVRIALGASRGRVIRHLLAESVLLTCLGAIAGLGISFAAIKTITLNVDIPLSAAPDWRTLLTALIVGAFAVISVGFIPTFTITRRDLNRAIKDGGEQASAGLGQARLRSLLAAVQVAGSCILLLFATVAARNLQLSLKPGFDFDKVAVFQPTGLGNAIQTKRGQDGRDIDFRVFWSAMRPAIAALPETADLALATTTPFVGPFEIVPRLPDAPDLSIAVNSVDAGFFRVMKIPILVGRPFDASDDRTSSVIISRRLATQVYGTLNVVGRIFPLTPLAQGEAVRQRTIVGVAEDARTAQTDFFDGAEYYLPLSTDQFRIARLLVRARTDPRALVHATREASRKTYPQVKVEATLLSADYTNTLHNAYLSTGFASGLASLTLLLACLGIFGLISYAASLRRKELSIRMALGATRRSVVRLLITQSTRPALWGMLFGFGMSIVALRITNGRAGGMGPYDASTFLYAALVLAVTCAVSALVPALRAVRGDLAQNLRND